MNHNCLFLPHFQREIPSHSLSDHSWNKYIPNQARLMPYRDARIHSLLKIPAENFQRVKYSFIYGEIFNYKNLPAIVQR